VRTLEAKITWATEANGCIERPFSGIQPSMLVAGELIMARIESQHATKEMERGQAYDVLIKLPYGEQYEAHLIPEMEVKLQVGERVIATGTVTHLTVESGTPVESTRRMVSTAPKYGHLYKK
jgi:hypothetical protein